MGRLTWVGLQQPLPSPTTVCDVSVFCSPQWSTADAEIKGYQKFPLSKSVVGQNIAVQAVSAYKASTNLVSTFPAHSTSFSPNFSDL